MGIYWWNALYFGRLLSRESHARLMNNRLVQGLAAAELDRFLSREPVDVDNGYRVPHLPGHFKKVGITIVFNNFNFGISSH